MSTRSTHGLGGAGLRLAVVGPGTLKGKELTEVLPESTLGAAEVRLLDDEESLGQLESVGDEMTFVQAVAADNFQGTDVVFFASDPKFSKKTLPLAARAGSAVVDVTYGLESEPDVSIRAPWIDRELSETAPMDLQPGPVVVAHPAAIVLALLMLRLQKAVKPKTAVVTIFEPASERGRKGLDELHQQTVSILSFQSLPKEIFDAQVAFNVLAKFGAASTPTLESTEKKIIDHFQKAVRGHVAIPSLVLLHASVFHGHAFSLYLETEEALAIEDVANSLSGEHVQVVKANEESPTNVDVAGQDDVVVSLRPDSQKKNGLWIWAAADNLRVTALNAIGAAEQLVASRPRGKVQ